MAWNGAWTKSDLQTPHIDHFSARRKLTPSTTKQSRPGLFAEWHHLGTVSASRTGSHDGPSRQRRLCSQIRRQLWAGIRMACPRAISNSMGVFVVESAMFNAGAPNSPFDRIKNKPLAQPTVRQIAVVGRRAGTRNHHLLDKPGSFLILNSEISLCFDATSEGNRKSGSRMADIFFNRSPARQGFATFTGPRV